MKRVCKRLTPLLAVLALVLSLTPAASAVGGVAAQAGNIDVTFNGAAMKLGTYNIASNNYVKLRDVAQLLKGTGKEFSITWNGAAQRIDLTSGGAYATVGGELGALAEGAQTAVPNAASVWLDGRAVTLAAYTINGNNFFKLRDLGSALDFFVGWDAATGVVSVDTAKGYVPETPAPAVDTSAMARAMLAALDADVPAVSYGSDACLADVDFDGVLELVTVTSKEVEPYGLTSVMSLYNWENGALRKEERVTLWGGVWFRCKNTATGEEGFVELISPDGDSEYILEGTDVFSYPSGSFSVTERLLFDGDSLVSEEYFYSDGSGERPLTRAEFEALNAQHQQLGLLISAFNEENAANIAAVRAQLNEML